MVFFYKIVNGFSPQYLCNYLPAARNTVLNLRQRRPIYDLDSRTERYRNSFFPYCISQWNILDSCIRDLPSISSFKRAILEFLRPKPSSVFRVSNHKGVILLTRLRVGFSHLREHKFRHGFLDILDPFCMCRANSIETTDHFLLHCSTFSHERRILFDNLQTLGIDIFPLNPSLLCKLLLYGDAKFTNHVNQAIINFSISFICDSNRFSGQLY